ncbi:hypothetical protein I7I51_05587 [Histoplasma capsulatum]|uniref:Uncharacterized protein n=1 Tax=Ajellomyces capsulatus TaxID=5037 RepID=A0A8A1M845_AJECA|nr:hypothetical protein I7I51_05587 [Histoplasma capsulatum]
MTTDLHLANILLHFSFDMQDMTLEQLHARTDESVKEYVVHEDGTPLVSEVPSEVVVPVWLGLKSRFAEPGESNHWIGLQLSMLRCLVDFLISDGASGRKVRNRLDEDGHQNVKETLHQQYDNSARDWTQRFMECISTHERMRFDTFSTEEENAFCDIMKSTLVLEPRKRATIEEAVGYEWMQKWGLPAVQKCEMQH